ncbi:MAG: SH3 domain-containing protein [Chloroflexi bacterium]|uniref:SH3 domain-containing protein n=1 Tax=Candidatus Flexifilum breve TaxID=3140694 RepID=UPI0031354838|nr:SH3 domain-containing protein [Chloroflexota bacterium]
MSKRTLWLILLTLALGILSVAVISASGNQEFGTNWTAQYYANATLQGSPVYTESLPTGINVNWGAGSPNAAVPVDNFTARFTSTQLFNQGTYEFVVSSDDGVRVYIDGALVWDRFIGRVLTTDRFQLNLTAGSHSLIVEYLELVDQAAVQFQYFQVNAVGTTPGVGVTPGVVQPTAGPTVTASRIPPTALPAIPPGALTGTVIRANVLLVRGQPFLGAPVVNRVLRGQTYAVVGRDETARWFLIQLYGMQGWVWGYYLFVNGNEFNAPIVGGFATAGDPANRTNVVGQSNATLRLRAAPTTDSTQTGRIPWGEILPVIGRTAGGDWYQVVFRGTVGWVSSGFVEIIDGDFGTVPVIQ